MERLGYERVFISKIDCIIFGIYLFFTESNLYVEDLAQNGLISFTGFYVVFNLFLLIFVFLKIISWKRRLKSS
ncbi:DUF5966 family protein [Streptococcus thermophilus]|uniref:DUF5966 family protein n=1 Tax=Streptococcus thermophilus TaxID=1308 RepID=UPI001C64981F